MMSISAWKHAAAWLVMAGMAGAGAIVLAASGPGTQEKPGVLSGREESKPAQPQPVAKPAQNDDTLKQMREQIDRRLAAARQRMESQRAYYEEGRITIDRFIEASHELMLAELSSSQTNEQKLAAAKSHWDRMVQVQSRERAEMTIGKGTIADVAEVSLAVENAAIEYLRMSNPRSLPDVEDLRLRVEALERQLEAIKKRLGSENAIRKVSPKR